MHAVQARRDPEVRWGRTPEASEGVHPGMGLQLVELPPADAARIAAFIQAREPLFYED